jgi:PTS system ascorbate-specific IIA component
VASANLNDFVPDGCVQFSSAETFLEAASEAAGLLVSAGVAAEGYPSEVIEIINQQGPYMVVAPHLAIVHGRPSEDSSATAASLLLGETGWVSGNEKNDPVHIVFAISASDDEQHIEMLRKLAAFLVIPSVIGNLQKSSTVSEVRQILSQSLR